MSDPVTMNHPGIPGDEDVTVERAAYRNVWYQRGWRSADDPGFEGPVLVPTFRPGEIIAQAQKSDGNFSTASATAVPVTGLALPTFVMPAQPVRIRVAARVQVSNVGASAVLTLKYDEHADGIVLFDVAGSTAGVSLNGLAECDVPDPFRQFEPGDSVTPRVMLARGVGTGNVSVVAQDAGAFGKFVATIKAIAG